MVHTSPLYGLLGQARGPEDLFKTTFRHPHDVVFICRKLLSLIIKRGAEYVCLNNVIYVKFVCIVYNIHCLLHTSKTNINIAMGCQHEGEPIKTWTQNQNDMTFWHKFNCKWWMRSFTGWIITYAFFLWRIPNATSRTRIHKLWTQRKNINIVVLTCYEQIPIEWDCAFDEQNAAKCLTKKLQRWWEFLKHPSRKSKTRYTVKNNKNNKEFWRKV